MEKLQVRYNKSLKLTNACIREVVESDQDGFDKIVIQMENYIKSKGATPVGPLIQCVQTKVNQNGELDVDIQFILQTSTFLRKLEPPYRMEPVVRCKNCLYVRFSGEQSQLKFAYDKLNLVSFEEDIPLTGRSYTVFTSQDEANFSADIFMEKANIG